MGIEPTFSAWEADVLPLNDTRIAYLASHRIVMPSLIHRHGNVMIIQRFITCAEYHGRQLIPVAANSSQSRPT